ncbi:hypothetical protein SISNIDRAFT_346692 [Sistotremastrum niveocremeum HHB9708]|uniref:Uncharacterized protein n=1 Tax=Sistotremastrum niveocremeum HHB9708 TaxID=1314777 RepID=A0A164WUK7_9AGAM|nr:hypothetical protein SISNIDRAFT_346692 [Sistotremastrum niveocremeum HHB9708]
MSVQTQSPVMDSKFLKRKAPLDDEDYEMSQRPVKVFKTLSGQTTRMIAKWRMNLSKTFNTAIQNSLPSPPVDQIDRQFTVAPLATVANEGRVYRLLPTRLRRPTINETSNTVTPSPDATQSILPTAQHPLSVSEQREPGVSEANLPATDEGQVVELSEEALKVFDQHQELLSPLQYTFSRVCSRRSRTR